MKHFIKMSTAFKCPIHQAIVALCASEIAANGYFNKEKIIQALHYEALEAAIRWDYIAEFLINAQYGIGLSLIPVAQKFFKESRHTIVKLAETAPHQINLNSYLAGGHSRKTAGYVLATANGGLWGVAKLKLRQDVAKGCITSALKQQHQLTQDFRKSTESMQTIPMLEFSANELRLACSA